MPILGLEDVIKRGSRSDELPETPLGKALFVFKHVKETTKVTATLGFITLAILILCRIGKQHAARRPGGAWVRLVPEILVVVVGTTGEYMRATYADIFSLDWYLPMGQTRYGDHGSDSGWLRYPIRTTIG